MSLDTGDTHRTRLAIERGRMSEQTISDLINELIRPRTYTVTIPDPNGGTRTHTTTHPSLLDELEYNPASRQLGSEKFQADMRSKPAGRIDAIALLQRIDKEAGKIARAIGSRRVGTLRTRLSSISGTAVTAPDDTQAWIHAKVRGWVVGAKVITGWDAPPYTPDVPCAYLECEKRGSMRIRLEDQVAYCVECGSHWGPAQINQLGNYVKWASEHLRGPRHTITTEDGAFVDCPDCWVTRQEMTKRAEARRVSDTPTETVA